MPSKLARACAVRGCPDKAIAGSSRCGEHTRQYKRELARRRPSTAKDYGRKWRAIRALYLKYHPDCEVCGKPTTDVDHIIPKREGGTSHWDNLQALCHSCHSEKTAKHDGGGWQRKVISLRQ